MIKSKMDYFLDPNSDISDQITNTIKRRNDSLIADDKLILKDVSRARIGFVNLNAVFENKYEAFFELNDKPIFTGKRHCLNDGYKIKNHWSRYCGTGFCCNLVFKDIRDAANLSLKDLEFEKYKNQIVIKGYPLDYTSEYESHYLSRDFIPIEMIALGCSICLSRDSTLKLKATTYSTKVNTLDNKTFYLSKGYPVCERCSMRNGLYTTDLSKALGILTDDQIDDDRLYYIKYYSIQSLISSDRSDFITRVKPDKENYILEILKKKKSSVFKAEVDSLTLLNVESHKSPINPNRKFSSMDEFLVYQNLLAKDESGSYFYDFTRFLNSKEAKSNFDTKASKKKRLAWN